MDPKEAPPNDQVTDYLLPSPTRRHDAALRAMVGLDILGHVAEDEWNHHGILRIFDDILMEFWWMKGNFDEHEIMEYIDEYLMNFDEF